MIEDSVLDQSAHSRLRTCSVALDIWDGLPEIVNNQLHTHGMAVTVGATVGCDSDRKSVYAEGGWSTLVAEDRQECRKEDIRDDAVYCCDQLADAFKCES